MFSEPFTDEDGTGISTALANIQKNIRHQRSEDNLGGEKAGGIRGSVNDVPSEMELAVVQVYCKS